MLILGIESSCDDTGVAIVENGRRVLASSVSSQTKIHASFGGVVPEIAAREHLTNIFPLYQEVLRQSGLRAEQLDGIAVSQGPGLVGALLVGISFAKGLSRSLGIPLIPVDHVHAHIHGALLGLPPDFAPAALFPGFALVVSGGHTHLYSMTSPTNFTLLVNSVDDACGECFDKVAKLLGLPYPGGPAVERLAERGDPRRFPMPQMLANKKQLAFSYSGLKTHVAATIRRIEHLDHQAKADLCAAFQEEAFGQIARKLKLASAAAETPPESILVAGGVAANQRFKAILAREVGAKSSGSAKMPSIYFPRLEYCSDNGAMVAAYGWYCYQLASDRRGFLDQGWDAYASYRYG